MMQQRPRAASFDQASATALYQTYAPMIFGYLRRQTPSREDAEDLTLDVFLAAFERGGLAVLPEDEQVAWLRQVARYKLTDYYRRRARRSSASLDAYADEMVADEAQAASLSNFTPGLALASTRHETQYSRLFRS